MLHVPKGIGVLRCGGRADGRNQLGVPRILEYVSIGLRIENNRHSEACRVIVGVGAVIQHQPLDWNDFEVIEAIREHGAVAGNHVEARSTSRAMSVSLNGSSPLA